MATRPVITRWSSQPTTPANPASDFRWDVLINQAFPTLNAANARPVTPRGVAAVGRGGRFQNWHGVNALEQINAPMPTTATGYTMLWVGPMQVASTGAGVAILRTTGDGFRFEPYTTAGGVWMTATHTGVVALNAPGPWSYAHDTRPWTVIISYDGTTATFEVRTPDGEYGSATTTAGMNPGTGTLDLSASSGVFGAYLVGYAARAMPPAMRRRILDNPWSVFERRRLSPIIYSAPAGPSVGRLWRETPNGQLLPRHFFDNALGDIADSFVQNEFFGPAVLSGAIVPTTGSIDVRSYAPGIALRLAPSAGSVDVTGYTPAIALRLAPSTGSVDLVGYTPSIRLALAPTSGSLDITGYAPSIGGSVTIAPSSGGIDVTGYAPAIRLSLAPTAGSIDIAGYAPSLRLALAPAAGGVDITGYAPALRSALAPGAGSIDITGYVPAIGGSVVLVPGTGGVDVGGGAPSIRLSLAPATGGLDITGYAPLVSQGAATITIAPTPGSVDVVGYAPTVVRTGAAVDDGVIGLGAWRLRWEAQRKRPAPPPRETYLEMIARDDEEVMMIAGILLELAA